jgi:hypothetical protein
MKKIFGILFALVLVLSFSLVTATPVAADPGTTYYVSTAGNDASGSGTAGNPWRTIQYAIGQVSANDTIIVAAGLYKENTIIDKSLTLKGAQAGIDARTRSGAETIIEPNNPDEDTAIHIVCDANRVVVIDGLTVQNARHGIAVEEFARRGTDIIVQNVRALNLAKFGISAAFATRATVEYCYVKDARYGLNGGLNWPFPPTVATFRYNEVVNTQFGILGYLGDSLIEGNLIRDFPDGGAGIIAQCLNTTVKNNTVANYTEGAAMTFEKSEHERLLSENVTVKGNSFRGNLIGIYVAANQTELKGITVNFNNIADNSWRGVWNDGDKTLDATRNWWGDASGPGGGGPGEGDAVVGGVRFEPWLGAPLVTVNTETVTDGSIDAKGQADTQIAVNGRATVTVVQYADNPGGNATRCLTTLNKYIDVYVPDTDDVTELEIKLYYANDQLASAGICEESLRLFSWNGTAWAQCSDSGINTTSSSGYRGYIWAKIRGDTTPTLAQLTGTPFGGYCSRFLEFSIATLELPPGKEKAAYEVELEACMGAEPYTWAITNGALPDGLALDTKTGIISGTPTRAGVFDFTAKVTDAAYIAATAELSITIEAVCFVASAAYGTDTAKEIDILREFRDEVLLPNSVGARFISLYYEISPPIADFVSQHLILRTAVRVGFVDPIVVVLDWSHGLWSAGASQ